jgi:acetyltransferase-like isoleucine patch superfamily enzyme
MRPAHVTRRHFQGPLGARARLWWKTRRRGALLLAPFRLTGSAAGQASGRITVGEGTRIGQFAWFSLVGNDAWITIGKNCTLSASLAISARSTISIGDGTSIAERCLITDHGHDHLSYLEPAIEAGVAPSFGWELSEAAAVTIGSGVHVGVNVVILPGVQIGDGAVIGANSVVSKSVPAYTVVVGAPARPIRTLLPPDATGAPSADPSRS